METMVPKPIFDAGTALFGATLVLAVLGARSVVVAIRGSNLPVVGRS